MENNKVKNYVIKEGGFSLPNDFVTVDYLATFTGMVLVLGLIVQFTKSLVKQKFSNEAVRLYTFAWASVLVAVVYWNQGLFNPAGSDLATNLLLGLVNAMVITLSAMGGYELVTDPYARKL